MAQNPVLLPLSAAGLGLTGLFTIPVVISALLQIRKGAPKDNFYQDRDGKSTPEAVAAFSNRIPKAVVLFFSALGVATSIAVSVFTTLKPSRDGLFLENWMVTASWGLILLQAIFIGALHQPVLVHDLGRWTFGSSLGTLVVQALQIFNVGSRLTQRDDSVFVLRIVNVGAALFVVFASSLIPRRPRVFFRNQPVDAKLDSSLLNRNTWTWVGFVNDLASKKGDLEEKDIPQPDHTLRAQEVVSDWNAYEFRGSLLWSLFSAYKARLALQWSIAIFRCFLNVGPFWTMLQLIHLLEEGERTGGSPSRQLWGLVILLGVLNLLGQWSESWINVYSITMISLPMKAQLSALVYEKSLRRKDVKAVEKTNKAESDPAIQVEDAEAAPEATSGTDGAQDTGEANGSSGSGNGDGDSKSEAAKGDKDDGAPASSGGPSVLKTRQAVVNLVGVDSRRISNFAAIQFFIISSVAQLVVNSAFLIKLIGWIPFIVGILAWGLVLPFNTYFAKRYAKLSEELMKARDEKLAVVNEALLGMRQIKFSALENQWEERIQSLRRNELRITWRMFLSDTGVFGSWIISPILLASGALTSYALLHGGLSPSVAFVSITIFKALELSLGALPELFTAGFDALVSVRRVDTYLKGPELTKTVSEGPKVAVENASIAWPVDDEEVSDEDRFVLRDLNLLFPTGELSVISGKTGTGKSLILSALIGEADLLDGKIFVPPSASPLERNDRNAHPGNWILSGSVAYVAQSPWLENASLRDNVLFGLPFVESRYNRVLDVCALKKDLEMLTDGDKTELGANGINLSGGQKWRITLARAIYSRAEILIMDDIFSAVDAHVGRHIFQRCIGGDICKGRTRILVTHHVKLVEPLTKFLVELGDGTVLYSGTTEQLAENGTLQKIESMEQQEIEAQGDDGGESSTAAASSEETSVAEAVVDDAAESSKKDEPSGSAAKKFVEEESREKGVVKSFVYWTYVQACGGISLWSILALVFVAYEAGDLGRSWWLKIWTGGQSQKPMGITSLEDHGLAIMQQNFMQAAQGPPNTESNSESLTFYLGVYLAISLASGVIGTLRFWWSFRLSVRGSRELFKNILHTVMRTPLRWLDTVPVGRILNRLTADFEVVDQQLMVNLSMFLSNLLGLMGVCVAGILVSLYIFPLALILVFVAGMLGNKYLGGARPLKRMESTSKSPVFELFNTTLAGIPTIRAFQKTGTYVETMYKHLDLWDSVSALMMNLNRWLGFRLALLGTAFPTCIGVVVVSSPWIDAAMAGFALSFAVDFSMRILFAIRSYSSIELFMNAAERIVEYSRLETEPQGGIEPPAAWPTSGRMEVEKLEAAYAPGLSPVLKGVSFDVKDNERIGVIGRTGAGKSSLTLALFRFIETRSGTVTIDGLDISKVNLHSLRSRLAIIPQDPVLFSGTIRSNLDPFNDRSDAELRESLARAHLIDSAAPTPANEPSSAAASTLAPQNANIFRDLSSPVSESGGNLSQGQRQLLCLARAIVSRPKIMVLDEATSAVDMSTDALIQRSIREEFSGSTLIVIAHRLSTVADFDRILVLSDGQVAEYGSPRELWDKEDGIFRDMCESSGEKDKLETTIFGNK